MAADAELVARALHGQADTAEREAQDLTRTGPPGEPAGRPLTRRDVLAILADHDRQLAAGITSRLGSENDLT